MSREIGLFIFAISAVPVATFLWEILWGLLAYQKGAVMNGIKASWKRAIIAGFIMVSALTWLHYDDVNMGRGIEERHMELIETMNQNNKDLIDRIDRLLEAIDGAGNATNTR